MSVQGKLFDGTTKNHVFHCLIVSSLALLLSCTAASGQQASYEPLVFQLAKDPSTSLYTIAVKADKLLLLLDLAGSLVWSTCPPSSAHGTAACQSGACGGAASQQCPRRCLHVDPGWACNPVTRECSSGGLTSFAMSANTTDGDGTMELRPEESFAIVGACVPDSLLRSLPAGATGFAGFSRRPLSLPSQVAAQRGFGGKFALCLPALATLGYPDVPPDPYYTPLLANPANPAGYYIPAKGISVSWHEADAPAALRRGALDLDAATGQGGVVLSTATPYMFMRPDVFRAFARAFDAAITRGKSPTTTVKRVVPAPKPFELCYKGGFPMLKQAASHDVPRIHLELGDGATGNWTLLNDNYMVEVDGAMCLGILPMGPGGMPVDGEPAVVIGGKQLEGNLLVFDLEKQLLHFRLSSCSRRSNLFGN